MNLLVDSFGCNNDEKYVVHIGRKRSKVFKTRLDYFDILVDVQFFNIFRLTKRTVLITLNLIKETII